MARDLGRDRWHGPVVVSADGDGIDPESGGIDCRAELARHEVNICMRTDVVCCDTFGLTVKASQEFGYLLTPYQAAFDLGVSRQAIYQRLNDGKLTRIVVFGVLMVSRREMIDWLSIRQVTTLGGDLLATGPDKDISKNE